MNCILGIDAAWTPKNPSGVALIAKQEARWRLVRVASSYGAFRGVEPKGPADHRPPLAESLLKASLDYAGSPVDLVSVDMPMARTAITSRRHSDNEVSRLYGARKCGTHSPSESRPGAVSENLRSAFAASGYDLLTEGKARRGLIECYPHPALLELLGASERITYKFGRIQNYWPELNGPDRKQRLLATWAKIVSALDAQISNVAESLVPPAIESGGLAFKAFEDALDSVVCAWVGLCAFEGRATPIGDEISAIWIPTPV